MLIEIDENNYCTGNFDVATIGQMINYVYVEKLPDGFEDLLKFKSYKCIIAPNESSDEDGVPYSVTYELDTDKYETLKAEYKKAEQKKLAEDLIIELKKELAKSDYQIIKTYESSLVGEECEYDIKSLHEQRQLLRDKINELESELS